MFVCVCCDVNDTSGCHAHMHPLAKQWPRFEHTTVYFFPPPPPPQGKHACPVSGGGRVPLFFYQDTRNLNTPYHPFTQYVAVLQHGRRPNAPCLSELLTQIHSGRTPGPRTSSTWGLPEHSSPRRSLVLRW